MAELTELDAYKQLLDVTQNILQQLTPQEEILKKYLVLKKSVLAKIKSNASNKQNSNSILQSYKTLIKNMLQCVTQFEAQIQGQMSKSSFLKNTAKLIKQIDRQAKLLNQQVNSNNQYSKGAKLMLKQELNNYKFACKEFEGKIQNMSLMIQVHRKMHEIILEASEKEIKTAQKQAQYNKRLNEMEDVVDRITDVKKFISSYEVTQKMAKKFDLARKSLAKVLFDL